jgi:predicted transcriptional regulator
MYNTKYECRYDKDTVFLKEDKVSDNEKEYILNILYQEDYLAIFSIKQYDAKAATNLSNSIGELYEKIKDSDVLKDIMKKAASTVMSIDLQIGLCILYSYDYMYITHKCVSEYLDTNFISLYNIDKINKLISNK